MAVRSLVNIERLTTAHVNSIDGSMTYESGVEYKANTTVSYNGSLYTANVDIEDTDTDTPDIAPDIWSLTINASEAGTSGDISALAARVSTLEETVGDETDGLVKDVNDMQELLNPSHIRKGFDSVTVTAGDSETYKTLLNKLASAFLTKCAEYGDQNRIEPYRFTYRNYWSGIIMPTAYFNDSSSVGMVIQAIVDNSTAGINTFTGQIRSDGSSKLKMYTIDTSGVSSYTDLENVTLAEGREFKIDFELYELQS